MKSYENDFVPQDMRICPIDPDAEVEALPEFFGVDKFLETFGDDKDEEKKDTKNAQDFFLSF